MKITLIWYNCLKLHALIRSFGFEPSELKYIYDQHFTLWLTTLRRVIIILDMKQAYQGGSENDLHMDHISVLIIHTTVQHSDVGCWGRTQTRSPTLSLI